MIILSLVVTKTISFTTRKSSMDNMQTITSERAHIIQTYVENTLARELLAGNVSDGDTIKIKSAEGKLIFSR